MEIETVVYNEDVVRFFYHAEDKTLTHSILLGKTLESWKVRDVRGGLCSNLDVLELAYGVHTGPLAAMHIARTGAAVAGLQD